MKRAIGLIVTIIAVVVAVLSVRGTLPFMPIYGSSMEPTLHSGSLMFIQPINNPKEIKVGDIIVYNVPKAIQDYYNYPPVVSHRVIKVNDVPSLTFRTQGDNTGEDPFTIRPGDVRGTVGKQIPYLGLPMLFFQSKQGIMFAIIALVILALFLYGRELGQGGGWIHRGIFSPVINEEKKANRVISKKIELTEKKMDSTEQALNNFSAAVAEYAKHLASHTSAIQGLSEASHELKRGAAEQNRVLSAMLDNIGNTRNAAAPATGRQESTVIKSEIQVSPAKRVNAKKQYKTVEKPQTAEKTRTTEPNYHKALEKGIISYAIKHPVTPKNTSVKK
jgi:signal peptidase I